MRIRLLQTLGSVCLLSGLFIVVSSEAAAQEDKGESKENAALMGRSVAPKASDFDRTVTLDRLLSKRKQSDWSSGKAANVEGYVIQLEREEDGDYHIVLAARPDETDTAKWVIVEVTPRWSKRKSSVSAARIKSLRGKHIRATGWLFYEPDVPGPDPRGTRWELHPVTDITVL